MVSAGRARVVVVLAARRRRVREEAREVSIVFCFCWELFSDFGRFCFGGGGSRMLRGMDCSGWR